MAECYPHTESSEFSEELIARIAAATRDHCTDVGEQIYVKLVQDEPPHRNTPNTQHNKQHTDRTEYHMA